MEPKKEIKKKPFLKRGEGKTAANRPMTAVVQAERKKEEKVVEKKENLFQKMTSMDEFT